MGAVVARSAAERRLFGVGKRTRVPKLANADEVNRMKRLMSAFGTKRTWRDAQRMSAFGGIADIAQASENVRSSDLGTSAT